MASQPEASYDFIVIGAGSGMRCASILTKLMATFSGGMAAAHRAAEKGAKVLVVEKKDIGGTW